MERSPHKSAWKTRKKGVDDGEKPKERSMVDAELIAKLDKVKKYIMISAILAVAPVLIYLLVWSPIILYTPFINLIIVIVLVFFVYFPISDLLRKPEK